MHAWLTLAKWLPTICILGGGCLFGLFVEVVIVSRLKKAALVNKAGLASVMRPLVSGSIIILVSILGADRAVEAIPGNATRIIFYLHKILLVAGISIVTFVAARLSVAFVRFQARRARGNVPSISLFTNITAGLVVIVGALVILQSLGISVTPLLTALGVGGLAIALALQDTLSNLFAGLHIIFSGQVRPGDYVRLDTNQEGTITDITWRTATMKSPIGTSILIPNTKLASAIVTNFSQNGGELVTAIPIVFAHEVDIDKAEQIAVDIAQNVQKTISGVPDFVPIVRVNACNEIGVTLNAVFKVKSVAFVDIVKHEYLKECVKRMKKEGVRMAEVGRVKIG